MFKREKTHRLGKSQYTGFVRVSYTLCVSERKRLFDNGNIPAEFIKILKHTIEKYHVKNWIYVFMPDHMHFILEGNDVKADLWKAVKEFKQKTTMWLNNNEYKEYKWQQNYYDHIHRKEDELKEHVAYIARNPVRAGIVESWDKYEHTGSIHYDLKDIIGSL